MKLLEEEIYTRLNDDSGFSLIELAAVLVVLSTLGAFAIPNILNALKINRIEEAKALMNSYAADCLNQFRSSSNEDFRKSSPESFSDSRFSAIGYKTLPGKNKCLHFAIKPLDKNEKTLFAMDFRINESTGRVLKTAIPADNKTSFMSCKGWAGDNCGASEEQKREWERLAKLAKAKSDCENSFVKWQNKPSSGSFPRWNSKSEKCNNITWVFEGRITGTKDAYEQALIDKYGRICSEWESKQFKNKFTGGPISKKECGTERNFYFYKGIDQQTKAAFDKRIRDDKIQKCAGDKEAARLRGFKGLYKGVAGPDPCGTNVWMCNKRVLNSEAEYKTTPCGAPPPPPPPPPRPPSPPKKVIPTPPPGLPPSFCTAPRDLCQGIMLLILPQCDCWK